MTKMDQPSKGTDIEPMLAPEDAAALNAESRPGVSRRHLLMGAGLIAISGLTFARTPKRQRPKIDPKTYEALFPRDFGDWHALPAADLILPPESDLANRLYEHILTRAYRNSQGDYVMFLAAYSSLQIDDVQLHRPEVCYSVAGFDIASTQRYDLKVSDKIDVPSRLVVAKSPLRTETILYWTRVGDDFPSDWASQRLAMMEANLEGFYPDGILVRASAIADGRNDVEVLTRFYRDLTAHAQPETMKLLYSV